MGCEIGSETFPLNKSDINRTVNANRKNKGDESAPYSPKIVMNFGISELKGRKKTPNRKIKIYVFFNKFILPKNASVINIIHYVGYKKCHK